MVTYVLALCLTVHLCRRSALSRIQPLSHASKSFGRASSPSIRSEAPSFIVTRAAQPPVFGGTPNTKCLRGKAAQTSCLRYTGEPRTRSDNAVGAKGAAASATDLEVTTVSDGRPSSVLCFTRGETKSTFPKGKAKRSTAPSSLPVGYHSGKITAKILPKNGVFNSQTKKGVR